MSPKELLASNRISWKMMISVSGLCCFLYFFKTCLSLSVHCLHLVLTLLVVSFTFTFHYSICMCGRICCHVQVQVLEREKISEKNSQSPRKTLTDLQKAWRTIDQDHIKWLHKLSAWEESIKELGMTETFAQCSVLIMHQMDVQSILYLNFFLAKKYLYWNKSEMLRTGALFLSLTYKYYKICWDKICAYICSTGSCNTS